MFFWNSLAFSMIQLFPWFQISGSSAFSKISLNIWKFTIHVLLKSDLGNFECYFTSMWDECNCVVVWAFFGIAFLCDWNENWPFSVLWPLLSFPNLLTYWVQHFHSIIWFLKSCISECLGNIHITVTLWEPLNKTKHGNSIVTLAFLRKGCETKLSQWYMKGK